MESHAYMLIIWEHLCVGGLWTTSPVAVWRADRALQRKPRLAVWLHGAFPGDESTSSYGSIIITWESFMFLYTFVPLMPFHSDHTGNIVTCYFPRTHSASIKKKDIFTYKFITAFFFHHFFLLFFWATINLLQTIRGFGWYSSSKVQASMWSRAVTSDSEEDVMRLWPRSFPWR